MGETAETETTERTITLILILTPTPTRCVTGVVTATATRTMKRADERTERALRVGMMCSWWMIARAPMLAVSVVKRSDALKGPQRLGPRSEACSPGFVARVRVTASTESTPCSQVQKCTGCAWCVGDITGCL